MVRNLTCSLLDRNLLLNSDNTRYFNYLIISVSATKFDILNFGRLRKLNADNVSGNFRIRFMLANGSRKKYLD